MIPQSNQGLVIIRWTVRALFQNSIKLVVSEDSSLSGDDVELYFSLCNLATLCGQKEVYMLCDFDTNNIMQCGLLGASPDLTNFLDTIPKNAYIIIESCLNGFPLLCSTRSQGVRFQ